MPALRRGAALFFWTKNNIQVLEMDKRKIWKAVYDKYVKTMLRAKPTSDFLLNTWSRLCGWNNPIKNKKIIKLLRKYAGFLNSRLESLNLKYLV